MLRRIRLGETETADFETEAKIKRFFRVEGFEDILHI